ncbi:UBX domain-containing protein 11 isoform X4 [Antechinus flavipes]|uniref:UBX domain-containing protein 11 isoform X3 n=1 Tax=Sarcophilus harrisii TaxID=9305 RepID=UPI001301C25D|nr:UBX domain-containing protein 11 isoform X3 [Sarcophilus harrisii]XP_051844114.1 UBX domain-containing protein 11 isoform X4 [Antechinus flavipes]
MSSPLASLSKTRRVPLQSDVQNSGRRALSSRMKIFGEEEDDLSSDGLSSEERSPGPGSNKEKSFHVGRSGSLPPDMGLVSSLVKRLNELEQKVKTQAEEINLKDQWIKTLKLKIKNLQPGEGESTVPAPTVDFDELLENLRDLSLLAGEGQSLVHTSSSMAVLKTPEPVPLTLYQNGIIMFNGPFRPFSDVSTQQCIQDILDGFFPSELKKIYPSGVPFQVTDLRSVVYQEKQLPKVFSGPGYVTGTPNSKETKKLNDQSAAENPLPFVGNTFPQTSTITKEQFLKKLPKFVIRHGEVIEVREPIRETLEGCTGPQEILVETESPGPQGDGPEAPRLRQSSTEIPTTTLRIKSENGEQTFVLPMSPLDTIGDIRRYLAQARNMDPATFEIFTVFPPTVYTDDSKTLQACGLVPNAILLLRPPRTPHPVPSL